MNSTSVAARSLIDTGVLVYRYDARFPEKQPVATRVLHDGIVTIRNPFAGVDL